MHVDYTYHARARLCPFIQSRDGRSVARCLEHKCAVWDRGRNCCGLNGQVATVVDYTGPELPGGQE
jgi:hypothetical protein